MRNLSSRESECLYWMAQGKTADETACILKISKRTVECHRENCRKKIGAHYSFTNLLFLVGKYSLLN
jgi:DNA-binding CsgD family transcriptional regulator